MCDVKGCKRTDQGSSLGKCAWHSAGFIECECCDDLFVGVPAECARMPVTAVQRRENGPDFVGFPLCDECKDHDAYECEHETEEQDV